MVISGPVIWSKYEILGLVRIQEPEVYKQLTSFAQWKLTKVRDDINLALGRHYSILYVCMTNKVKHDCSLGQGKTVSFLSHPYLI